MAFHVLCLVFLLCTSAYSQPYSTTTHLHLYMHDDYTGPNPTAERVVSGHSLSPNSSAPASPRQFGDIAVLNDPLTEGPGRFDSARVGTAQGFAVRVSEGGLVSHLSLHLVLESGEYNGSTVTVNGRIDMNEAVRESVVLGGTGRFQYVRGYMLSRNYDYDLTNGGVVELDVYLEHQP